MANLLTGDYEAVLQVSQGTLNRLLASMHQHRDTKPRLPSFPHTAAVRLGDVYLVDGVRGTARAQVGVPRMTFIDGATDRFQLEVGLRIRYTPDPDTESLPSYIHGTLKAVYALEDIDPNCPGWRKLASKHLWIRVVEDSVSFTGSYGIDEWFVAGALEDDATLDAKVTTQLRALLTYSFEPAPHEVSPQFRKGSFKTIVQSEGSIDEAPMFPWLDDVDVGGSAVAMPVGITQDPDLGAIGSIQNVVLAGSDFAVGLNVDTIMGMVNPALDGIRAYAPSFEVSVSGFLGSVSTVYHGRITSATAVWVPHGYYATIEVAIAGEATTRSVLPDFGVTITETFTVGFDAGNEALYVVANLPGVQVSASGVGLPGDVLQDVATEVQRTVKTMADNAAASVQPSLQVLTAGKAEFVKQLQSLDDRADARFDGASFYLSGVVARGWVAVANRRSPVVKFKKVGSEEFSAYDCWIPGGRVDRMQWEWTWKSASQQPGEAAHSDRYVLARPPGRGKFGLAQALHTPLPGLDGGGHVCLTVYGKVVDVDTGRLVAIEAGPVCHEYGAIDIYRIGPDRLYLREFENAMPRGVPHPPGPVEHAVRHANALEHAGAGTNTLIVYVDGGWDGEMETALVGGLEQCRRDDAGLQVLVLFPEDTLDGAGAATRGQLEALGARIEAPVIVNEDVAGGWTDAFVMSRGDRTPAWRLLSPDGGVLWMQDGHIGADALAGALDGHLYPSGPASPSLAQGDLGEWLLDPGVVGGLFAGARPGPERRHCPDWTGLRDIDIRTAITAVAFVRRESKGFDADVARLQEEHGNRSEDDPDVVVVLDGADERAAQELQATLGPTFTVIPDGDGSKAGAVGVRVWPTTVRLGEELAVAVRDDEEDGR